MNETSRTILMDESQVIPETDGSLRLKDLKSTFGDQITIYPGFDFDDYNQTRGDALVTFHEVVKRGTVSEIVNEIGFSFFTQHQAVVLIRERFSWICSSMYQLYIPVMIDGEYCCVHAYHDKEDHQVIVCIIQLDSEPARRNFLSIEFLHCFVTPYGNSSPRFRIT